MEAKALDSILESFYDLTNDSMLESNGEIMKIIYTKKGEEILVDDDDYERLNKVAWYIDHRGYAVHSPPRVKGKARRVVAMHREVMGLKPGDPQHVDHRFGIKADNRKSELRLCDNTRNHWNMKNRSDNTSGYKGVFWSKKAGRWAASICAHQNRFWLGLFDTPEEAHAAYCKAAVEFHGEFANFGNSIPDAYLNQLEAKQAQMVIAPLVKTPDRGVNHMKTKIIATAVAGMTLVCSQTAYAESFFQIEAGIGGSAYQRGPDGLWIQDGFEHDLHLTAPAIEAGLTGNIYQASRWGVSWHADYVWLATVHTQGLATPSDANYNLQTKSCNGSCWPMANYLGSGHNSGFILTLEPHYDYAGWRFGVEAGPYLFKNTWSVDVQGWRSTPDAAPENIHVENKAQWKLGYVVGASVGYKNFRLNYQYFANKEGVTASNPYPPVWSGTHVLLIKYRANVF